MASDLVVDRRPAGAAAMEAQDSDAVSVVEPTKDDWEALRPRIEQLYIHEGRPLPRVVEVLERDGFVATERMYKTRLLKWKMRKSRDTAPRDRPVKKRPLAQPAISSRNRQHAAAVMAKGRHNVSLPLREPSRVTERQMVGIMPVQVATFERMVQLPDPYQRPFLQAEGMSASSYSALPEPSLPDWNLGLDDFGMDNIKMSDYIEGLILMDQAAMPAHTRDMAGLGEGRCRQPLHRAAEHGRLDAVQYLLRRGDPVDAVDDKNVTPLWLAAQEGHTEVVRTLLAANADPSVRTSDSGRQAIHQAAQNGHTDTLHVLFKHTKDVDCKDKDGETPLILAAQQGDWPAVKLLLDAKADPNAATISTGYTPLHQAAQNGHSHILRLLMSESKDIDASTNEGVTPLWLAAQKGDTSSVLALLERGASPDTPFKKSGRGPLHQAIQGKHQVTTKLLIEKSSAIDAYGDDGATPLFLAANYGLIDAVAALLAKGANPNAASKDSKRRPLHQAAQEGHDEVVKLLLANGAEVNAGEADIATALFLAAQEGHLMVIQHLLNAKADPNVRTTDTGRQALHQAAQKGHSEVVELLLQAKCDVDVVDFDGITPLWLATQADDSVSVAALLQQNANPNLGADKGEVRALHKATLKKSMDILKMLLDARAEPDPLTFEGDTPLAWAAEGGDTGSVALLLSAGADPNRSRTMSHRSPLHQAAANGHRDIVELLLQRDADINALDSDAWTPLLLAAHYGRNSVVRQLLEARADPTVCTVRFDTQPLHHAAHLGYTDIVDMLAQAMPYIDKPDFDGETPLMHAANKGNERSVAILLERGADPNRFMTQSKRGPLHQAAQAGYDRIVRLLLQKEVNINAGEADNATALWLAAQDGRTTVVQTLLEAGADPNVVAVDSGRQAIHQAVMESHSDIVLRLLAAGAEYDRADLEGATPLFLASQAGDQVSVLALLEKGANINHTHKYSRRTPLHQASQEGHEDIVRLLLKYRPAVDARESHGAPPLLLAAQDGHLECVKLLLASGADLNIRAKSNGRQALHQSIANKHTEIALFLIDKLSNVDVPDYDGETPLWLAAKTGDKQAALALLEKKANPNSIVKQSRRRPIHEAAQQGNPEIVMALMNCIPDIDVTDIEGCTPLLLAAERGHQQAVGALLNSHTSRADPNAISLNARRRPLHLAAENGYSKTVAMLIASGAEVDPRGKDGETPLLLAAENGDSETVITLLAKGANPNESTAMAHRPLHLAAQGGHAEIVQLLLEKTVEFDTPAQEGETPLYLAVQKGDLQCVNLLLARGANPNVLEKTSGLRALHQAAKNGYTEIVAALLDHKARINEMTTEGRTPLMLACQGNHEETIPLLLKRGADPTLQKELGVTAVSILAEHDNFALFKRVADAEAKHHRRNMNGMSWMGR